MNKVLAIIAAILVLTTPVVISDSATMSVSVGSASPTVDSVVVNDASPTAGTTTQITVTTQITDTNGVDDIKIVGAAFTTGTPANGNNLTNMKRSICTNVDTDTIQCIANYNMQFYDDDQIYNITVTANDAASNSGNGADSFTYSELVALELDVSSIAFGSMNITQTKEVLGDDTWGASLATVKNQGNAVIDSKINATDFIGDGTDSFSAGQADRRFGALSYVALSNAEVTETGLSLNYGPSQLENIDFRLIIPLGALPETYTSTVSIVAVANS